MPKYRFCPCFSGGWMCLKAPPSATTVHLAIRPHSTSSNPHLPLRRVTVTGTLLSVWLCLHAFVWGLDLLVIASTPPFLVTQTSYCPFALPFHDHDMLLEHYPLLLEGTSCVPHCNIIRSAYAKLFLCTCLSIDRHVPLLLYGLKVNYLKWIQMPWENSLKNE
jgi:hypothetical protein